MCAFYFLKREVKKSNLCTNYMNKYYGHGLSSIIFSYADHMKMLDWKFQTTTALSQSLRREIFNDTEQIYMNDIKTILIDPLCFKLRNLIEMEYTILSEYYSKFAISKFIIYLIVVVLLFLVYLTLIFQDYGEFIWRTESLLAMLPTKHLLINLEEVKKVIANISQLIFYTSDLGFWGCLLYTSPSPRDLSTSRMPSSA
eukprot:TRINITY_DN67912_c0_g1_i2.p1 TRINITY_DN67912_c0_g1~~TRINITY_DN67912_c0_g1_i2.p1  ORF type:complete len:199 (-),score=21.01 TRINITY_DN67912_c0_g1_i2:146-742(-)